jgi:hypothetical protein
MKKQNTEVVVVTDTETVTATEVKRGRGRPRFEIKKPETNTWTMNDVKALNPDVCALSLYQHKNRWIAENWCVDSGERIPTGGVGKPLTVFIAVAALQRSKVAKKAAKTRKMNSKLPVAPPVDMVAVPVTDTVAVTDAVPVTDAVENLVTV